MNEAQHIGIEQVISAPSLYPEEQRKPSSRRRAELERWLADYGEVNECYNLYGMDLEESGPADAWLDRGVFRKQRYLANSRFYPLGSPLPYNSTVVMRDKKLFEAFAAFVLGEGGAYCVSLGMISGAAFSSRRYASVHELLEDHEGSRLVFKQTYGCSGEGVIIARISHGMISRGGGLPVPAKSFIEDIARPSSTWLIQEFIRQHDGMARFNGSSVNTLRILTYNTGARVVEGPAVLRFGGPGAATDNADAGGLATSVSEAGVSGGFAFDFVNKARREYDAPNAPIPFFDEARSLVVRLHEALPEVFSIGWDVAVTARGPVVVEGNDGWDPYLTQMPRGNAQRRAWDALLAERVEYFGWKAIDG